ncbi:DNA replication/repair protein RecF [Corallincola spongiicola]|uniref:DNA replication and repair protein RecF n=1 Tax=Corallincola spongiicola TaxID=2520508 RepID=A0ABY1WL66_9GAMM|nr:DNA replication/repair protein RecF [Corallincola spongiicola]TAA41083.1 DNA replication/repair protein RecF [Corallincola spongiicola]
MSITRINISDLRNLKNVGLELGPSFNFFFGENGAGKTSLLEAVYLIHAGRSFRTSDLSKVIANQHEQFFLYLENSDVDGNVVRLGLSRARKGVFQAKVDGDNVSTLSALASHLPVQIVSPESLMLLSGGNKERRKFIDWGVFHVEQRFHECWRRSERLLAQRNRLLKTKARRSEFSSWDQAFVKEALELTTYRQAYVTELLPFFSDLAHAFFPQFEVKFVFRPGWTDRESLADILVRDFDRDCKYGYTQSGPHRSGFSLRVDGQAAEAVCSRGQLKLLVCCLKLAQAKHLRENRGVRAIFLLDDIESELDGANRQRVLEQLRLLGCQALITLINREAITSGLASDDRVFHVEQGCVKSWQFVNDAHTANNND